MGYISIDVDVEDIIGEIDNEDLIEELTSRGYEIKSDDEVDDEEKRPFIITGNFFNSDQLYRHLCDIVGCGYHEPKESVLDKLKDMM